MDDKQKSQKTVNDLLLELAKAADTMSTVKKTMTREYLANLKAIREEAEASAKDVQTEVSQLPMMN